MHPLDSWHDTKMLFLMILVVVAMSPLIPILPVMSALLLTTIIHPMSILHHAGFVYKFSHLGDIIYAEDVRFYQNV